MMKMIDAHGEALDLLDEERDLLEESLRDIKPKINRLMRFQTAGEMFDYNLRVALWGGDISKLTKFRNDLRRRLKNVEETRRLLKADRADQQQDAWDDEQYRIEASQADTKTFLPCGCW